MKIKIEDESLLRRIFIGAKTFARLCRADIPLNVERRRNKTILKIFNFP